MAAKKTAAPAKRAYNKKPKVVSEADKTFYVVQVRSNYFSTWTPAVLARTYAEAADIVNYDYGHIPGYNIKIDTVKLADQPVE